MKTIFLLTISAHIADPIIIYRLLFYFIFLSVISMSTTARSLVKPKNLTLMDMCNSMHDLHQTQPQPVTAQILTRRLYLHPLSINANTRHPVPKTANSDSMLIESEKKIERIKPKPLALRGIAIVSTSLPVTSRSHHKNERRYHKRKSPKLFDSDLQSYSNFSSSTVVSLNQSNVTLPPITLKTKANSNRSPCSLYSQNINKKISDADRARVWFNFDNLLQQPELLVPPSTPFDKNSEQNHSNIEREASTLTYKTIQEIKIYKRNPIHPMMFDDEDPFYDETLFI